MKYLDPKPSIKHVPPPLSIDFEPCDQGYITLLATQKLVKSACDLTIQTLLLGDPEVTANIYRKTRNIPNTDTQNYSTDLR